VSTETIPLSAREGYALWAETWDHSGSPVVALEERLLAPWLTGLRPRCAIDIGCGTGRWTARLGAIGVDPSIEMLSVAHRKPAMAGRLVAGDAAAIPIESGAADLVLCTLTLGHVANWAGAMRELARVVAPGGTLVLTDFHPDATAHGWRRTFRHEERVYELENYPYTVAELQSAADELTLQERVDARFGSTERELFESAGRADLFAAACSIPAVLLTRWTRA
jgi:ubiquinone/menaquinone biosynthesis C-methylase UbiE